jgi:hypothetical protein
MILTRWGNLVYHDRSNREDDNGVLGSTSSKKLLDMGFSYKYGVEDIFDETIKWAQSYGILK